MWGVAFTACVVFIFIICVFWAHGFHVAEHLSMVTMVTMGGDLQPGSLADRLLTGLGQPQINP
jgi:hypothetical protein